MKVLLAVLTAALIAGCAPSTSSPNTSSDTSTSTSPVNTTTSDVPATASMVTDADAVVVEIVEIGGCMMMGPNCSTFVVYRDGSVQRFRSDAASEGETVDEAVINAALVDNVAGLIATTDFAALRRVLPSGECQSCYDGTDTTFIYQTPAGSVTYDSQDVELVTSEPLFAATWAILAAADAATEMPLVER